MPSLRYLDFDLQIERQGDHYVAQVLQSPAGEASCPFTLPFTEDRLENLVLKMSPLRGRTRGLSSEELTAARELGGRLFECVFSGEVLASLRSSLDEANRQDGVGLRLKLRLQGAPDLADLPWEYLFDPAMDRFIAQSDYTPIVRYMEMPQRIRPLATTLPLQLLVMISSPTDPDYPPLDVEREKARLQQALEPLTSAGKVKIDWLETASLPALQTRLRSNTYHIFHFIGHGGFDQRAGEGVLVLEDEQGRAWQAAAYRIGPLLHDHRSLRLAVLNSCEGARNSRTDPFAGMAASLIRQGIPAVVAMQFEITDGAAITFGGNFYSALADGYPVDAAVAEARKGILVQANDIEWGTPVLYMRSADGVLFDLAQTPAAPLAAAAPTIEPTPAPATAPAPRAVAPPTAASLSLTLQPRGGSAFDLLLHNSGDAEARVRLTASSASADSVIALPQGLLTVPGRSTATVAVQARPRKRRWLGSKESRPFTLAASGDGDGGGPPLTVNGSYDDQPIGWLPLGGGGLFAGALAVGLFFVLRPGGGSSPDALVPTPEPTAVGTPVAASGTGDLIYFQSTRDTPDHEEIYVANADGTNLRRVTTTPQTQKAGEPAKSSRLPDVSSDGRRIAFVSNRDGATSELYVMASDGSGLQRIPTVPDGDKLEPNISPDGRRIVFEVKRTVNNVDSYDLYVVNLDGSGLANLTSSPTADIDPYWSPDGTKIVFGSDRQDNDMEIWVMNQDGGNPQRLTRSPGFDGEPAWSPDGQSIAFESSRAQPNQAFDIYVMRPDGSNQLPVRTDPTTDFDPAWSPDSLHIAYSAGTGSAFDVYVVNSDGSNLQNLTKGAGISVKPVWSPKR